MTYKIHLFVLVHGLWGTNSDLEFMKTKLVKSLPNAINDSLFLKLLENSQLGLETGMSPDIQYCYIYDSSHNNSFKTYDGIEMCGKRLQLELYSLLDKCAEFDNQISFNKISFISYSLGGLISRYCLGLLYNDGFFEQKKIGDQINEFENFITFVSPHVGVISKNSRVAKLVGHTGVQLYLKDKDKLLYQMSLPNSSFVQGLKRFKNLRLYSNCINDLKTNFFTTAISHFDPFSQLHEPQVNNFKWLKFVSQYEGLIIDYDSSHLNVNECRKGEGLYSSIKNSITIENLDFDEELSKELDVDVELTLNSDTKFTNTIINCYNKFVSIVFLLLFIIFRTPYEICLSYTRRSKMIKLYREDFKLIKHIKVEINDASTDDEEEINSKKDTETTPMLLATSKSNEEVISESFNSLEKTPFSVATRTIKSIIDKHNKPTLYFKELVDLGYEDLFHLKQTFFDFEIVDPCDFELQHEIIKNMNQDIKWERYPVIIRKSKFSHAAIIVRYDKPKENFEEGIQVINHLIDIIAI